VIRAILFDLDGTLLDTAGDLVAALNHLRDSEGMEPVAVPEYRHFVSRGAMGLIHAGMPAAAEPEQERRKRKFLEYYAANSTQRTAPFQGVGSLLESLAGRGIPWGVVTNKMESLTLPILQATGLLPRSACVVCGDTLAQSKPHPAPVRLACEILRVDAAGALMVGDDLRDLEAGRAAGTQTAWAAYGYVAPEVTAADLSGSHVIQQPMDILRLLGTDQGPLA
jgi:phosphoglycolate phosphatase